MKHYTMKEKNNGELAVRWLSEKAQKLYRDSDPLDVFERETDDGRRYDVSGMWDAKNLTLEELEKFFEEIQDILDEQDEFNEL